MAVQKRRKSRSRRDMRRAHDSLQAPTLAVDPVSGEPHRRHAVTADGFYRGLRLFEAAPERGESASAGEGADIPDGAG